MYQLDDISNLIKRCDAYLASSGKSPEIENILTCYLLVHICGEYEKLIKAFIVSRASKAGDSDLANYLSTDAFRPIRSLLLSELKDNILKNFGERYVESFESKKTALGDQAVTSYGNIVVNRNKTAHGEAINYTFKNLADTCDDSNKVVDAFLQVLSS